MTDRDYFDKNLPAFGFFNLGKESQIFAGRLEFDRDKKVYLLNGILESNEKGFEALRVAMTNEKPLEHIKGEIYGFGHVDIILPDGRLAKSSSTSISEYAITFKEIIIQQLERKTLPRTVDSCIFSSHYISNMWFGHSGFKSNPDFNQMTRYGSRIYEVTKEIELAKTDEYSISLYNHYYESSRFEIFSMIEEKVLKLKFPKPVIASYLKEVSEKLSRFLQFVSGRYEPFKFITYSSEEQSFRHYLNRPEHGDRRDIFTRSGFLVPYEMLENRFNSILNEWMRLESDIPYVLDRFSSAYLNLLSDENENYRIAFVDLCSCLDSYYQKEVKPEKSEFKKVIKFLVNEVTHPKIKRCYNSDFHLNVANTRHSFVHDFDRDDARYKYVLQPIKIKRYATKLKALFEYLILKRHFHFTDDEIYKRIANPWPNMIYLEELYA